jgi:hypothetical protein
LPPDTADLSKDTRAVSLTLSEAIGAMYPLM